MANNFRTIYLYIVSLITLCMIVGGIVSTINNITSYFYPDSYIFFEENTTTSIYDTSTSVAYNNAKKTEIKQNKTSLLSFGGVGGEGRWQEDRESIRAWRL